MKKIIIFTYWNGPPSEYRERFHARTTQAFLGMLPYGYRVHLSHMTYPMTDLRAMAYSVSGHVCGKNSAYAMCDLRPLYAVMFKPFVYGYDWWGWCDLDMVFGNVSDFLTPELLAANEVISDDPSGVNGPFTILRNNERCNTLFRQWPNLKGMLGNSLYENFDEKGFTQLVKGSGIPYHFGAWSSHDRHKEPKGCELRMVDRGGGSLAEVLVETPTNRQLFAYHFPGSKQWPLK